MTLLKLGLMATLFDFPSLSSSLIPKASQSWFLFLLLTFPPFTVNFVRSCFQSFTFDFSKIRSSLLLFLFSLVFVCAHKTQFICVTLFLWAFLSLTVHICFVYPKKILFYFVFLPRSYKKYERQKNLHLYLQDSGRQLSKQTAYLVINLLEEKCVLLIRMCIFDISFAVSIELNINPLNHSEY